MATPPKFIPGYSYSGWQESNPAKPLPAPQVDNDFANASRSINETIDYVTGLELDSKDADKLGGQPGSFYLDRSNHTGKDPLGAIDGLPEALEGEAPSIHTHAQADVDGLTAALAAKAPLNAPVFTDYVRFPTLPTADTSDKGATTAFVKAAISAAGGGGGPGGGDAETLGGLPPEYYLALGNHTGELPQSAITGLEDALSGPSNQTYRIESDFTAATIPSGVDYITVQGIRTPGDGGAHVKKRISAPGAPKLWHKQSADGAWWEVVADAPHVKQLGAYGNGSDLDDTYVAAFAEWQGYLNFMAGTYRLSTQTINVPLVFEWGAAVTGVSGQTLTIRNRIVSGKQWIFKGDMEIRCEVNGGGSNGEDSRYMHASWMGIFPQNSDTTFHQTEAIRKLYRCYSGGTREGVIEFDNGAYRVAGTIDVYRGTWTYGTGSRRTTFRLNAGFGGAVFRTQNVACRFTGFQFETTNGEAETPKFDGSQIQIDHSDCVVEDISFWSTRRGVQVNGDNCRIETIRAVNGADVSTFGDSALVEINASFCHVRDVREAGTTNGHNYVICIGRNQTKHIYNIVIDGVQNGEHSIPVAIRAGGGYDVFNVIANNINDVRPAASTEPGIYIATAGSSEVRSVTISNYIGNEFVPIFFRVNQTGTGVVKEIVAHGCNRRGSGTTLHFSGGGGQGVRDITIGDDCFLGSGSSSYSGIVINIKIGDAGAAPTLTPTYDNVSLNASGYLRSLSGALDLRGASGSGITFRNGGTLIGQLSSSGDYTIYGSLIVSSGELDMRAASGSAVRLRSGNATIMVIAAAGVYGTTTASAANAYIGANDTLMRSTSSGRYKTDVEDMSEESRDIILKLRPRWYRSLCEADNPRWSYYGLIAEEVAAHDPRLVHWRTTERVTHKIGRKDVEVTRKLAEPLAEGVMYDRLVPHLIAKIQQMEERLLALES